MTLDHQIRWLFRINAVINWVLSVRGIIDPVGMASTFGGPEPNYLFLVRLWTGFVFMFGYMFWEVARDVRGKSALIKYNWIEKTITALAITIGYFAGQVPGRLMILIFLTNWLWIPILLYYDVKLQRVMHQLSGSTTETKINRKTVALSFLAICSALAILFITKTITSLVGSIIFAMALALFGVFLGKILSVASLLIGLFALVKSVLERRGPNRLPVLVLIRDRFPSPQLKWILMGLGAGSFLIVGPLGLSTVLGWAQLEISSAIPNTVFLLGLMTIGLKVVWATIEELVFRGAILPQSAKVTNGLAALIVSSLLFSWGHLERGGTTTPDLLSLLVFGLDGVGFGIAYLATRNLWLPTIWHTAKNIWIWILFGESTLQLTPGFFQVNYSGPMLWVGTPNQAGLLDLTASFIVAAVVLVVYRHQFVSGLEWVKSQ